MLVYSSAVSLHEVQGSVNQMAFIIFRLIGRALWDSEGKARLTWLTGD